jgi:hypothetical protein
MQRGTEQASMHCISTESYSRQDDCIDAAGSCCRSGVQGFSVSKLCRVTLQ